MQPTKKIMRAALAALVFVLVLLLGASVALAAPTFNRPINSDSGHVANAIALSKGTFSSGVPAAVVTTADSYADSLSASVLASVYGGPLLLTSGSSLSADVASELSRLKPAKVFLVGLPSTLASSVKSAVPSLTDPAQIVSLKGGDRYETAALVARQIKSKVGTVSKVIIAPGDSYTGALAASSLAAAQGWPLLLTPAAGPLPQSTTQAILDLNAGAGIVVGTGLSIDVDGFTISKRIVGEKTTSDPDGRYDACAELADYAVEQGWMTYAHLGLVSGEDYPDGEVAVPVLARADGVLLLTKPGSLPAATSAAIKSHGPEVKRIDFVGIGWPVYREVKSLNSARVTGLSVSGGPVSGGNSLVLTGTAFNGASRVRVGKVDVPGGDWKVDSGTQLTIASVPAGHGDGPVEITVFNYWGASPSTTKDLYFYGDDGVLSPGEKVVREAVKYLGIPYLWAGSTPTGGFDCSGFTMYVYRQFGISLPHYSGAQAGYGTAVSKADLQPGDLVFFYSPISHVGMYVGGGMMINAPRSGDLVCIEDAFRTSYVRARRLLSPYARYEQTDSRLAFTGTWNTSSVGSASGGSFRYANASGSSVTVSFTGTYLAWIAKKSPVYGQAKVTLDGKAPVTIDLYSASETYLQKVWNTGTLASGNHTVRIEWAGAKNAAASDTNISVDGFDLIGSLTQATATSPPPPPPTPAPSPTRYEQTDTRFAFAGTWGTFSATGASGGGYKRTNASGSSVTVSFNGTYLAWIATKGTTLGKAKVSLDGGAGTTVDLAAASVAYQQKVWNTGTLASGNHTVSISWDATNASKYVSIDAFDVIGTVLQVSAGPAAPTPKPARHEQNSTLLTYAGGWTASSSSSASGGSFRFADSAGSAVTVTFTGSYLAWIAKKSPVYGKAKVTVDGGAPVSVDLYSANTLWQQKVWDTGTLASGAHTVRIEWTGSKSSGATDTNINVDALDIVGTLSQGPAVQAVRYEQNDTHFAYVGMWTASSSSSASGGSFRFADSAGSAVTVKFTGSYLAWMAKKSPVYGKAKVTVDGGTPMIVDLYSPSTLWKQKVWEKTMAPGAHTLRIEWTGTRSTSATETNIGVDAFDLIGVLQ